MRNRIITSVVAAGALAAAIAGTVAAGAITSGTRLSADANSDCRKAYNPEATAYPDQNRPGYFTCIWIHNGTVVERPHYSMN